MPRRVPQEAWVAEAAARFATIDRWRQDHPQATWEEIDATVAADLAVLRARVLQDTALASEAADLHTARPPCPACGTPLQAAGPRTCHLTTDHNQPIELTRTYARCPTCGRGLSPLDEELGLLPGAVTPPLQRHLSRLGTRLSFAEAASELGQLRGVTISAATARRRTETDGAVLVGIDDAEAVLVAQTCPPPPRGPAVQQLSVDGTLAPLVGGEWTEVKVVAIGTVEPGREPASVQATDLSYFGRRAEAAAFAEAARGEVQRRGMETAGTVAAVSDGAPWRQGFVDRHRPDAVRILDYPHASQRLTEVAAAVWGEGSQASQWAARQRAELLEGDPTRVLQALRVAPAELPEASAASADPVPVAGEPPAGVVVATDAITPSTDLSPAAAAVRDEVLGYLEPRRAHLAYASFCARGLPIGSGIVESAGKTVVAARLKGAGRRWAPEQINPLVALRGVLCSGRWDARWPQIGRARRAQAQQRTQARRLARQSVISGPIPAPVAAPSAPPSGDRPPAGQRPTQAGGHRTADRSAPLQAHRPLTPTARRCPNRKTLIPLANSESGAESAVGATRNDATTAIWGVRAGNVGGPAAIQGSFQ